jgi:hypothetical protein
MKLTLTLGSHGHEPGSIPFGCVVLGAGPLAPHLLSRGVTGVEPGTCSGLPTPMGVPPASVTAPAGATPAMAGRPGWHV